MKNLRKINQILLFIIIVITLFYFGATFLIPFVFGIFFAILMSPFANMIEKVWNNRIFSSLIGTLVVLIVVGGVMYIFVYQMSLFVSDISSIRNEIMSVVQDLQDRIMKATNLSFEEQKNLLQNRSENLLNSLETGLTSFLGNILNTAAGFLMALVYVFLLMYYRDKFLESILMYVNNNNIEEAKEVLQRISRVVYQYLWARAKVMSILAVMYYITLLIFDIPYALLLTIFGAFITIIPYLGTVISGLIPMVFSFIYLENIQTALLFSFIIIIVHSIESYILEPLIIGNEVKINPLFVIIAIVIGGMIWGLAGMILFVPIFAMFKIISNHTVGLKPIGYLFGDSKKVKR